MGDVADMLGLAPAKPATTSMSAAEEAMRFLHEGKPKGDSKLSASKSGKKPKGMKREVFDLLSKDGIAPAMQGSNLQTSAFKTKRIVAGRGKWVYAPIESSARNDNKLIFYHWVKADINYTDYPYAQFNVKLEPIEFTDEEYTNHLTDENWTREDTDTLLDICHKYELRWPVIFDRIVLSVNKAPEELQNRYYTVQNKLHAARQMVPNDKKLFDYDYEKECKRRLQQDTLFKRY